MLKALDVHIVGSSTENPKDEVLVLRNEQDAPELIVCGPTFATGISGAAGSG